MTKIPKKVFLAISFFQSAYVRNQLTTGSSSQSIYFLKKYFISSGFFSLSFAIIVIVGILLQSVFTLSFEFQQGQTGPYTANVQTHFFRVMKSMVIQNTFRSVDDTSPHA